MKRCMNKCAALSVFVAAMAAVVPAAAQQAIRSEMASLAMIRPLAELAERGYAPAQFELGSRYSRGEGVPMDDVQAASWWRKAAEQGLATAQNELGVALAEGRGVEKDPVQAIAWYEKAAAQGSAVAQNNLGVAYWDGIGVRVNSREAVAWFRKAAEANLGWAQFYLGEAYAQGRGVTQHSRLAVQWYRKAAEQDYVAAQVALGAMYFGNPVVRDNASSVYWLARAARNGDELALRSLEAMTARLPRLRLHEVQVREQPDAKGAVIKTVGEAEFGYRVQRRDGWEQVYFSDGHMLGYISTAQVKQ
jgi:TPR repeat protein